MVGHCFRKRMKTPNIFPAPTAGGICRGMLEGGGGGGRGVNMWGRDVTLWLAGAGTCVPARADMTGPLCRKICFDIYVENLNACFINQKC